MLIIYGRTLRAYILLRSFRPHSYSAVKLALSIAA